MFLLQAAKVLKQCGIPVWIFRHNRGMVARRSVSSILEVEKIKTTTDQMCELLREKITSINSSQRGNVPHDLRNLMKALNLGRMPPEIHIEFPLPKVIRSNKKLSELAHSVLNVWFLYAQSSPSVWGWILANEDTDKIAPEHLHERFGSSHRVETFKKYSDQFKKVGTMITEDPETGQSLIGSYDDVRHDFSNAPSFPNPKSSPLGPTHVALGFNDLQVLLPDAASSEMKAIRFIGYDRSAYSVAKTLVLAHMMRSVDVQAHHIIEVWYSSTWTYETLMFFRSSCLALLSEGLPLTTGNDFARGQVHQFLNHWAHTAVPLSYTEGLTRYFIEFTSFILFACISPCSFSRKQDRIALVNYFMTGEFGPHCFGESDADQTERIASLAMFSVPDGLSGKHSLDFVTSTILIQSLLDEFDINSSISIVESIYNMKARQIRLLQDGVKSGRIQLDLRYGDIKPRFCISSKLLCEIHDLKADTMSWSNLLDFFPICHIHELAHFWSTDATTHYGYTMNWSWYCYGTYIRDYSTVAERTKIMQDTVEAAALEATKIGMVKLILVPTYDSIEHLTSYHLCCQLQKYWLKYFQNGAQSVLKEHGTSLFMQNEKLLRSPLFRTDRSIYLSWKYR